jgi:hypothetical protein
MVCTTASLAAAFESPVIPGLAVGAGTDEVTVAAGVINAAGGALCASGGE